MDYIKTYFIQNFIVLCIAIVLTLTCLRKMKTQKRIGIYMMLILGLTVLITIFDTLQDFLANETTNVIGVTILASALYILRPACVLIFIFLSGQRIKKVSSYILFGLFAYNFIVNLFPYFEPTKYIAYFYEIGEEGTVGWKPGEIYFFRFTPHIVSILYLVFLIYKSVLMLQSKHIFDAIGIIICGTVVALATIIETFFNDHGDVYLLPTSIAVSTVFYYLFLYERQNKLDILTGLFNRASYYDDVNKFKSAINGMIQLDLNGLKYINDNFGHLEGDKAIRSTADAMLDNITRKMYAYRVGGDEFIILVINDSQKNIVKFVAAFKEQLNKSNYHCSIGYATYEDEVNNIEDLYKLSEIRMYKDKSNFYKSSNIKRRETDFIQNNN